MGEATEHKESNGVAASTASPRISDAEAFEMWLETGCVPLEYMEQFYLRGFSTAERDGDV
jgi:hypothetical protein